MNSYCREGTKVTLEPELHWVLNSVAIFYEVWQFLSVPWKLDVWFFFLSPNELGHQIQFLFLMFPRYLRKPEQGSPADSQHVDDLKLSYQSVIDKQ